MSRQNPVRLVNVVLTVEYVLTQIGQVVPVPKYPAIAKRDESISGHLCRVWTLAKKCRSDAFLQVFWVASVSAKDRDKPTERRYFWRELLGIRNLHGDQFVRLLFAAEHTPRIWIRQHN